MHKSEGRYIIPPMAFGKASRSLYQQIYTTQIPDTSLAVSNLNHMRVVFRVTAECTLRGLLFYRDRSDNANHIACVIQRGSAGNRKALRAAAFMQNPALTGTIGWNTKYLAAPLRLDPTQWYDYVLMYTGGVQWSTAGILASADLTNGLIVVPKNGSTDPFGTVINNGANQNPAVNFNPNGSMSGALPGLDILIDPTI